MSQVGKTSFYKRKIMLESFKKTKKNSSMKEDKKASSSAKKTSSSKKKVSTISKGETSISKTVHSTSHDSVPLLGGVNVGDDVDVYYKNGIVVNRKSAVKRLENKDLTSRVIEKMYASNPCDIMGMAWKINHLSYDKVFRRDPNDALAMAIVLNADDFEESDRQFIHKFRTSHQKKSCQSKRDDK